MVLRIEVAVRQFETEIPYPPSPMKLSQSRPTQNWGESQMWPTTILSATWRRQLRRNPIWTTA